HSDHEPRGQVPLLGICRDGFGSTSEASGVRKLPEVAAHLPSKVEPIAQKQAKAGGGRKKSFGAEVVPTGVSRGALGKRGAAQHSDNRREPAPGLPAGEVQRQERLRKGDVLVDRTRYTLIHRLGGVDDQSLQVAPLDAKAKRKRARRAQIE